ncbi:MAG: efflux RND transporter periplasmic adaptor subunit [Acidobacteriota bacterium]
MKRTAALVLSLSILALAGCKGKAAASSTEPSVIRIGASDYVVAQRKRITTGPRLSGSLAAQTEANVRAEIPGPLLDVNVQEGDRVTEGKLLARIDPGAITAQRSSQQSAMASARNSVALAEKELARQRALYQAGIVARATVDVAQQQVDSARSQLAQLQTQSAGTVVQARNATVEAPISGIVSKRWVSEGDVVSVGAALFTIVDLHTMQLEASVAADNLSQIRVGTPIQFTVKGIEGRVFTGRIARVNPVADPATRQIKVFAEIPNASGELASGLFAEGRLENLSRVGVIVPSAAIDHRMTTPAVTRVRGNRVEHFSVSLGVVDDQNDQVEVTSGVSDGDILLVGAAQQIAAGTQVELPPAALTAGDVAR